MWFSSHILSFSLSVAFLLLNYKVSLVDSASAKKSNLCAKLFKEEGFSGNKSDSFILNDGTRVSNFEEEYLTIDTIWNVTRSFEVEKGCSLTACNTSYFDGTCLTFKENVDKLPSELDTVWSASCSCQNDCKCSDIDLRMTSCARAYLKGGCNTCNPYYTDLKGSKSEFTQQYNGEFEALIVRKGCQLTIFEQEAYEGEPILMEGTHESWNEKIGSYECKCSPDSFKPRTKPPRPENYPVWVDIPNTVDNVTALMQGGLDRHPGLIAAKQSLMSDRSSKNAYILLIGTTGSGKSSTINLLFDNPNVTRVGGLESTTSDIHEFRISVPVDELGIRNSELRVIDTPGLGDTRGLGQDSKFLATLDDYLSTHEELHDKIPNVVLIFHKFNDNRFAGDSSFFVKMLRGLDSFRNKITDKNYSNVIFVLSHFCSVTKDMTRRPKKRLQDFKSVIQQYSQFPKPTVIAVAENKGEDEDLPRVNGYFKLPNGDFYPKNLFDKIEILTAGGNDPIGDAVIRTAFKDSDNFTVRQSTYRLVEDSNTKVTKYLAILTNALFEPVDTEISKRLAKSDETMNATMKKDFPGVLGYLQKALNIRDIISMDDVPRTTIGVLELMSTLRKNEATIYLLKDALNLEAPIYEENPVAGYSYNVFKDSRLSKSPYNLGKMINSDIGYLFPSALTCEVKKENIDIYQDIPNKADYLKILLSNFGIEGSIPLSEFKGQTKPGFNIKEEQFLNNSCRITAVREMRTFELNVNENPKLTEEFIEAVKLLPPLNQSDYENVDTWKGFFNEYGTHVVKSVHGGGSIVIELTSNKECDELISGALFELIQFAEDLTAINENSTKTLKSEGIHHVLKFHGGDNKYHTADLTKMSLGAASKLLRQWKNSLRLKPAILNTKMKLHPISSVARSVGQNISSEIQRATSLLFNSTLKVFHTKKVTELPTDRDHVAKANENKVLMDLIQSILSDMKESREKSEKAILKFQEDQRLSDERRDKAEKEYRRWETELRENQTRENEIQRAASEQKRFDLIEKHHKYQLEIQKNNSLIEATRVRNAASADRIRQQELKDLQDKINELSKPRPGPPRPSCLRQGTPILMADRELKPVEYLQVYILLDHNLKPTRVLGVSYEFLNNRSFYGFEEDSQFFTNTHLFVGPNIGTKHIGSNSIQLYAKDTHQLFQENPLLEYLEVKEMTDNFELFRYKTGSDSVESTLVQVFEDSTAFPDNTLVYFIQVDSPSGTYIANGFVCRHEIPPFEHWPNTMDVIFSVFSDPKLPPFGKIPFTLKNVEIFEKVVDEVNNEVLEALTKFSTGYGLILSKPKIQVEDGMKEEVLDKVFNNPSYSAFGVGIYAKVGKLLAAYLDNPESRINIYQIGYLQHLLVEEISNKLRESVMKWFGDISTEI